MTTHQIIQIFGAIAFLTGLFLFFVEQWTSGRRGKESEAGLKAWKIELGGPPSLIAMGLGALMIVLPIWMGDGEGITPSSSSTTTTSSTVPTVQPTTIPTISATVVEREQPFAWIEYDIDFCNDWAVFWWDDMEADYYFIQVAAMGLGDAREVEWDFESWPPLCAWEFAIDGYDRYWLWITSYYWDGTTSEPLFVEFVIPTETIVTE